MNIFKNFACALFAGTVIFHTSDKKFSIGPSRTATFLNHPVLHSSNCSNLIKALGDQNPCKHARFAYSISTDNVSKELCTFLRVIDISESSMVRRKTFRRLKIQ